MDELLKKLQSDNVITADQARVVAIESALSGRHTRNVLVDTQFASMATLEIYQAGPISLDLNVEDFVPDVLALNLIEENIARQHNVLPVTFDQLNHQLVVAMEDPSNVVIRDRVSRSLDESIAVEYRRANLADIKRTLDKCYGACHSLHGILTELAQHNGVNNVDELDHTPVVRLIDALLQDAITRRASDIHFSPESHFVQVRFRIDGLLQVACCLHIKYWPAMLVRIKVLSGLDIAETRAPQDGHVSRRIHGQLIDFRVASFPLAIGENLVLRVLDRRSGLRPLGSLCAHRKTENALRKMVQQPNGLILVCGPTGSGKTTTLYALLMSLNAQSCNIMTIEDPVEYPMVNIQQTRVQGNSGFDFADGVRAVLRQDPDVILVGEVRDKNSCAMTCRAAMTGHLVLTTTHADDCIGAIARLVDLGAQTSVLSSVLTGVVSQRLIRRQCVHCESPHSQCGVCGGSGYSGRMALFEVLTMTEALSELIQAGASANEIKAQAVNDGMVPLSEVAKRAIEQGQSNKTEIDRVLGTFRPTRIA